MAELNVNNKYHFKLKLFIGNKNQEFINISLIMAQIIQFFSKLFKNSTGNAGHLSKFLLKIIPLVLNQHHF